MTENITNLDEVVGTLRALKDMADAAKAHPDDVPAPIIETTLMLEKWLDEILKNPEENIASFLTTATFILAVNPELLGLTLLQLKHYGPMLNNLISLYKEVR